ncbi:MAG: cytochrome C [Alphaproteobacteria bacterium]|nr:cytochrome C [Alphaproteobacteria bacterium]
MRVLILLIPFLFSINQAKAERVGDPQAGYTYAKEVCAQCHGISAEASPLPQATRFREIADRPGVTGTALAVWLQTTHPTMPNIIVDKEDMWNVIAYILDLKDRDRDKD